MAPTKINVLIALTALTGKCIKFAAYFFGYCNKSVAIKEAFI